jgi:hypothetical protein
VCGSVEDRAWHHHMRKPVAPQMWKSAYTEFRIILQPAPKVLPRLVTVLPKAMCLHKSVDADSRSCLNAVSRRSASAEIRTYGTPHLRNQARRGFRVWSPFCPRLRVHTSAGSDSRSSLDAGSRSSVLLCHNLYVRGSVVPYFRKYGGPHLSRSTDVSQQRPR